ncbi:MAG: PAC2 family protein, partial [Promethearchaeota archaeon]
GCPGIADVGKFAIDSLIGQLKASLFMELIFDDYPAGAIIDNSLLAAPKAEILIWKDPNKIRDLILITADAQSLSPRGIYRISNMLTEIIFNFGAKLIVALGAYPVSSRIFNFGAKLIVALGAYPVSSRKISSKDPKIFITSTSQDLLDNFLKNQSCHKISKGVIIGANGLIPCLAKARFNIDGLVFLAETDNLAMINEDITDLKASILLLNMIKNSFSLPIKKKYSLENIDDITKSLQSKRDQLEKDLDTFQFTDTEDKRKSLYI